MTSLDRSPERRSRLRRLAGWVLGVAVLAALVVLGLEKIDIAQVGRALGRVRAGWVAAGFALMVGTFLSRGESWFVAIRAALPERPLRRATVTRILLIGMFGSTVAPGRLGEAARAWLIARRTGDTRRTLATVVGTLVSQTCLNLLALMILAAIALGGGAIPGAHTGAIAALIAIPVALLVVLMFTPRLLARVQALELPLLDRGLPRRVVAWVAHRLEEAGQGLAVFRSPSPALHSMSAQLFGWLLQTGACYVVLLAFGLEHRAGIATAAAVLFAVNVTAVLPLTPSNVGVFQAACIAVLAPRGIAAGTGLAYGLVLQAIEVSSATVLGLPSLLREGLSPRELRRQAHAREMGSG